MANPAPQTNIVSQYGPIVWATADVLRTNGFKASDWPRFMMPFFALMLLESRVLRARQQALDEFTQAGLTFDPTSEDDREDFLRAYRRAAQSKTITMHDDLLFHGQGLAHITNGASPASFGAALRHYLAGFDNETRRLLGVEHITGQQKYLDIKHAIEQLEAKSGAALLEYGKGWAMVNLTGYDSSAVTTLEEHIKRRWADISAETAGEQYTPSDLSDLVVKLAVSHLRRHPLSRSVIKLYDPTCGGGNMLYGVEDGLRQAANEPVNPLRDGKNGRYSIKVYGQELNDTLFALASIESRFRQDATIREGNTLTQDQFPGEEFDVIVANPPYGVDWKSLVGDIDADASGRFPAGCRPPVSDGQHLFLQHIQAHLAQEGIALVFCSGSTLFSGDAGGGESNARSHYTLTNDGVHGIIQLPKNEFFNTGINTYLWFFWKTKAANVKDRIFLLNAESLFEKLRKSLGSKNCQVSPDQADQIVQAIETFEATARPPALGESTSAVEGIPFIKSVPVDALHYNKVPIELFRADDEGRRFTGKQELKGVSIRFDDVNNANLLQTGLPIAIVTSLMTEEEAQGERTFKALEAHIKRSINEGRELFISTSGQEGKVDSDIYQWNSTDRALTRKGQPLGRAHVVIKAKVAKGKGGTPDTLLLTADMGPDIEKDVETTPFSRDKYRNEAQINGFLGQWVRDEYNRAGEPLTGCEINFNRVFPRAAVLRSSKDIQVDLDQLNAEIAALDEQRKAGLQ